MAPRLRALLAKVLSGDAEPRELTRMGALQRARMLRLFCQQHPDRPLAVSDLPAQLRPDRHVDGSPRPPVKFTEPKGHVAMLTARFAKWTAVRDNLRNMPDLLAAYQQVH